MIQTLDLPVLSLAIPNIHKLNDINTDNLSCMWTVFSKCKDNLENGRRLENMSWRLWYRESTLKEKDATQLSSTCPIPIQSTKESIDHHKHLSPASFKRIISSLNENEDILPSIHDNNNLIMLQQPQPQQPQQQQKQEFTSEKEEYEEEEEGWSSEDDEDDEPTPKNKVLLVSTKKFTISDDEDDDEEDEVDNQFQDTKDNNEIAFLSEFRKRVPITNVITRGSSILSNMLRAQDSTRLANPTIFNVVQNQTEQQQCGVNEELSTSMRKYVEWEKHGYQHDFILDSKNHSINYSSIDHSFRNCW